MKPVFLLHTIYTQLRSTFKKGSREDQITYLALIRLQSILDTSQNLKVPEIMLLFSLETGSTYGVKLRQGPDTVGVRTVGWLDGGQQVPQPPTVPHQGNWARRQPLSQRFIPRPVMCPNLVSFCHSTFLGTLTYYSPRNSLASSSLGLNASLFLKTPVKKTTQWLLVADNKM